LTETLGKDCDQLETEQRLNPWQDDARFLQDLLRNPVPGNLFSRTVAMFCHCHIQTS
jgi:hypothetical protein